MRKQYIFGLLSLLLFTGACSGDGKAVVTTTTTVPATTTTLDAASILEAKKANLLSELFIDNQVGDYKKPHKFFATTEEIQPILRKYGIFGNVESSYTGYEALAGLQAQRNLCEDLHLEELVASANPSRTVGRFFSWGEAPGIEDAGEGAMFASGGMNIFEVSNSDELMGFVADYFALRGGACKTTSYQYGNFDFVDWQDKFEREISEQWWEEQQLLRIGVEVRTKSDFKWDSAYFETEGESPPGFRIIQTAGNRSYMRVFKIVPHVEMGLLTVIELNILRNGTGKNSPSISELAETYGPAFAELEIMMESKLYDYLANG